MPLSDQTAVDFILPTRPHEWEEARVKPYMTATGIHILLSPITLPLQQTRLIRPLDAYGMGWDELVRHVHAFHPQVILDPYQPRAEGIRVARGTIHPTVARQLEREGSIVLISLARCLKDWQHLAVCRKTLFVLLKRRVRVALVSGANTPSGLRSRKDMSAIPTLLSLPAHILGEDVLQELAAYDHGKGVRTPVQATNT